jgi:hypothetical protein
MARLEAVKRPGPPRPRPGPDRRARDLRGDRDCCWPEPAPGRLRRRTAGASSGPCRRPARPGGPDLHRPRHHPARPHPPLRRPLLHGRRFRPAARPSPPPGPASWTRSPGCRWPRPAPSTCPAITRIVLGEAVRAAAPNPARIPALRPHRARRPRHHARLTVTEIRLRLTIADPVPGVTYSLQDQKSVPVGRVVATTAPLSFDVPVKLSDDGRLTGPFVRREGPAAPLRLHRASGRSGRRPRRRSGPAAPRSTSMDITAGPAGPRRGRKMLAVHAARARQGRLFPPAPPSGTARTRGSAV